MVLENNREIITNLREKIGFQYFKIEKILEKHKNINFVEALRTQRIKFVNNLLNKCFISNGKKASYFHKEKNQRKFDRIFLNG